MRHAFVFALMGAAALASAACGHSQPAAGPSDPTAAADAAVFKILQVAPARVECVGVAPMMCLQVRDSADAAWTRLYEDIVGFAYEPGYLYEIRIKEEKVANPPADASSLRRTLVAILSKTAAPTVLIGPTWRLVSLDGRAPVAGTRVTAVFADEARVSGSAGCNGYFGRAQVTGDSLAVGALGSTRMYCGADGVMTQEGAYLEALEKATAIRIDGAELRLGPAPGVVSLVFRSE